MTSKSSQVEQRKGVQVRLTNTFLLQIRQSLDPLSLVRHARHIQIAISIHGARRTEELDARFDEACEPEHEKDKGAQDYYSREEDALADEDEDED